MNIIDLSHRVYNNMPVHPYDDRALVMHDKTIRADDYNNTRISLGMHTGTHIDAPKHLIENGLGLEEYSLDRFISRGCLLDVRGQHEIRIMKEYIDRIKENNIVLLYTGWDSRFSSPSYFGDKAPVLSEDFARFLADKKVSMVGMDLPSPDRPPFNVHKILLGSNILIIENLTNLHKLLGIEEFIVSALPLSIAAEGSISRVVAISE